MHGDGILTRDRDPERLLLARRLDGGLDPQAARAYAESVLSRLDTHGDWVASVKTPAGLLREIAEELLDVGGWAIVLGYAHPVRSPRIDDALRDAIRLAARAWRSVNSAADFVALAEQEKQR